MIYRPLLSLGGVFAIVLGLLVIVAPHLYLGVYLSSFSPEIGFGAQRFAPVIIGLGALLWAARGLEPGPVPSTLCAIAALVWAGVAATGVYHYSVGIAGFGILIAALAEVFLAALFWLASRQMRHS